VSTEEVPEGWRLARLGDCLAEPLRNGHSARATSDGTGIRTLTLTAVTKGDFSEANTKLTVADSEKVQDLWLEPGDILIERSNTPELVGTARLFRGPRKWAIFPDLLIRVRAAGVLPEFLELALSTAPARQYFQGAAQGSAGTMPKIDQTTISDFEFPLPDLPEQQRIVAKVEELLASVNAARDSLARVPAILKRFRQAVLAAACDGRLTGADTSDWTNTTLGEVFSVQTGATPLRKRTDYYLDGTIPWIKTAQVQNREIHHAEEFITDLAVEETNAKVFPPGTILVAMYGEGRTRGQLARLRIAAATNQACAALVPRNRADDPSDFVFWFLRSQYDAMRDVAVGGNQPNLSLGLIKSWPVALPSPSEQRQIVRRIEALIRVADAIEKRVAESAGRAEKLAQAVFAKGFRGELVAPEPAVAEISRRRVPHRIRKR
jgi:type I restriction enzyme S subunit